MKKIILFLLSVVLLYSCSTSTDSNGNTNTTIVPLPPTNLTGTVDSTTQINLSWTDNSTNEIGFKIERKTGSGNYAIVGTTAADITSYNNISLISNTTYTFRVYSYNAVGNSLTYSNEVTLTTQNNIELPIVTTTEASNVTTNSAVSGGNVTSDGGGVITARGVCWCIACGYSPTIIDSHTVDGSGTGTFTSNLTNLLGNVDIRARAYATNSVGTAYGNEINFTTLLNSTTINVPGPNVTDIDGNIYQTITNCGQTWTKSNLNVSHYKNGDVIPQVTDPTQWANLTTGAWCYYANTSSNGTTYGKLYNWYAVNDTRGLAPVGYHIPTDDEWSILSNCLGGDAIAGGKMKETGSAHWQSPNTYANNLSGFTGLPSGARFCDVLPIIYGELGGGGYWWSSTVSTASNNALYRSINSFNNNSMDSKLYNGAGWKIFGFSVRCIKD